TVNAADPGIVNTKMITMEQWFDPLTDILFRPFIKTAEQGAATAVHLALSDSLNLVSGCCYANCKPKRLPDRIARHPQQKELWNETEHRIKPFLAPIEVK
ncbi:MAG: oxidoreductase, partial [Bacteroidaceae bacterium]|nr:oxidoreductase [Bacteroidaceae bacterium]